LLRLIYLILILLPLFCYASDEKPTITAISEKVVISLDNGQNLELAGIIIPDEMLANATKFINNYVGEPVELSFGNQQQNRYGNYIAQANASGKWLEGGLLAHGLALVYPTIDNDLQVPEMLAAEKKARNAKIGLWANPENAIISDAESVANLLKYKNKFKIIEGRVFDVRKTKDKIYINFDKDWKTDFSIGISKENFHNFPDVESLKGRKIRVRGWVESYNGPFVEIYEEGQIEEM
jgi:micrococcal nuclease